MVAMSLRIEPQADRGRITATLTPPQRNRPKTIYLRLRHPQGKPIQSATLNGARYERFDAKQEWIMLPGTLDGRQEVVAHY